MGHSHQYGPPGVLWTQEHWATSPQSVSQSVLFPKPGQDVCWSEEQSGVEELLAGTNKAAPTAPATTRTEKSLFMLIVPPSGRQE
jgi:hypothetical protein